MKQKYIFSLSLSAVGFILGVFWFGWKFFAAMFFVLWGNNVGQR